MTSGRWLKIWMVFVAALLSVAPPAYAHDCNPDQLLKRTLRAEQAKRYRLHRSDDSDYTIFRVERRGHFTYVDDEGEEVNARTLKRIENLKIRVDLKDVKISDDPRGHIQAVGVDAKGRRQYIYHPSWLEVRKTVKFESTLPAFGQQLPDIRAAVTQDLRGTEFTERRLIAAIVRLLDDTLIRIGNPEYAKTNHSYGLTTLRKSHVKVDGTKITFSFPGKSGVFHETTYESAPVAKLIRDLLKIPGWSLFKFQNERGEFETVDSDSVNAYLKEVTQNDFTAKDFRTWGGTVAAAEYLHSVPYPRTPAAMIEAIAGAAKAAADELENTPAVSKGSYIHPRVLEAYQKRPKIFDSAFRKAARRLEAVDTGRSLAEEAILNLLEY